MFIFCHLVDERDGLYISRREELLVLCYYANSIRHLLLAEAVDRG